MARPRKDEAGPSVEQRLHAAFWELIAEKPVDAMTVGDLAKRAGCNRSTFYYYYDDIYELLDAVIDESLPKDLPTLLLPHFAQEGGLTDGDREFACALQSCRVQIDRLCMLLANASSASVTKRIKQAVMGVWASALSVEDGASVPGDARIVLEFGVNGILGIMAYRAETGFSVSMEDILHALAPEVPDAMMGRIRASRSQMRT